MLLLTAIDYRVAYIARFVLLSHPSTYPLMILFNTGYLSGCRIDSQRVERNSAWLLAWPTC